MKKMFAKLEMPSILSLVFLLGGLLFSVNNVSAQNTQSQTSGTVFKIKTTGTWKSTNVAISALQQEINALGQLMNTNPGNISEVKMRFIIYSEILSQIEGGKEISAAAYDTYYKYAPASGVDGHPATPGISQAAWSAIYTDMVNLLLI